jgi:enhancing lycopene biosynthesis protein 2
MVVVAVVLSGCGVFDGTEVHEVSAACAAISRSGAEVAFFAPDGAAFHEVNHLTGEAVETKRNILIESARIARGKIRSLSVLHDINRSGRTFLKYYSFEGAQR